MILVMKKAIYAGAFDPFTNGHLDIVQRGAKLFDQVMIVVAVSPNKKALIPIEERKKLIGEIFKNEPNIQVDCWDGLIIDYAKKNQFQFLLRGLRPTGDFESEFQMASMNARLYSNIETFFLPTSEDLFYVSSSLVKEIYGHGGDISPFVPREINEYLNRKTESK